MDYLTYVGEVSRSQSKKKFIEKALKLSKKYPSLTKLGNYFYRFLPPDETKYADV